MMNAPQVAVDCLGRVQEVAPRTSGCERGGDFLANKTGFAHAADNDAACAAIDQVHRLAEGAIQAGRNGLERASFDVDDFARVSELFLRRDGVVG